MGDLGVCTHHLSSVLLQEIDALLWRHLFSFFHVIFIVCIPYPVNDLLRTTPTDTDILVDILKTIKLLLSSSL